MSGIFQISFYHYRSHWYSRISPTHHTMTKPPSIRQTCYLHFYNRFGSISLLNLLVNRSVLHQVHGKGTVSLNRYPSSTYTFHCYSSLHCQGLQGSMNIIFPIYLFHKSLNQVETTRNDISRVESVHITVPRMHPYRPSTLLLSIHFMPNCNKAEHHSN